MHKLPVKETVRAYFGGLQVPIIVDIDADIVDVIFAQMLFDEEASKTTVTNALKAFELKESTDDNGSLKMWYSVMLKNSLQFYCIVDYLSVGCSFRQSAEIDMATRERTRIASMGSLNQGTIAKYARVCCAMNYMELKMLLSEDCWTFSVALDMSNHQATGYLDIRVRVYTKGKIQTTMLSPCQSMVLTLQLTCLRLSRSFLMFYAHLGETKFFHVQAMVRQR